jgi:hypothetical protein
MNDENPIAKMQREEREFQEMTDEIDRFFRGETELIKTRKPVEETPQEAARKQIEQEIWQERLKEIIGLEPEYTETRPLEEAAARARAAQEEQFTPEEMAAFNRILDRLIPDPPNK